MYTTLSGYVPKDWIYVAAVDESESYEVDVSEIWRKPDDTFLLVTASGCSCWEGDYEVQEFESLDELENIVLHREGNWIYNPSPAGARELVRIAKENLGI
jgi:hypothetical protein